MKTRTLLLCVTLTLGACGQPDPGGGARPGQAPRPLGAADGTGDQADLDCQLVLRSVGRIPTGPGYATTCDLGGSSDGECRYVWEGLVDVQSDRPESPEVLYRTSQTGSQWYAVPAQPIPGAPAGFTRYRFRIEEHTPAPGMSLTSLNQTVIELIPYLAGPGGRLFDHNRVADPLGSYRLELSNMWQVGPAPQVCPAQGGAVPQYVLDYPGFRETLVYGPLKAGGQLRIRYDGRRLRETQSCLGAQGPVSSTTLRVGYIFDGDGSNVQTAEVERYVESYGYACPGASPCVTDTTSEPLISLPATAQSIQMWFYCVPGFSGGAPSNWKYDSNQGQNYVLTLAAGQGVDWAGNWQLHAARSGLTSPLPDPYEYTGFTNMGLSVQAELYVKGLTDQPQLDTQLVRAYVETDLTACTPGGALQQQELQVVKTGVGPYGNNALYRWGVEGIINSCPKGSYRYRFLFTADGGQSFTPLGAAPSTADPGVAGFRTILFK